MTYLRVGKNCASGEAKEVPVPNANCEKHDVRSSAWDNIVANYKRLQFKD